MLVPSLSKFDPNKHLRCSYVVFLIQGLSFQFGGLRPSSFVSASTKNHCPTCQDPLFALLVPSCWPQNFCPLQKVPAPFFCYQSPSGIWALIQTEYLTALRHYIDRLGINSSMYSSHLLSRGGASWILQCGLPSEIIKLQGEWASNAYENYLNHYLSLRKKVAETMGKSFHIPSHM